MSDTKRIYVKSPEEIRIIRDKIDDKGFIIECEEKPIKNVTIPSNLHQRLIDDAIPILKLNIPNHIVGLIMEHSLDSLLDSLSICNQYCVPSNSIECLIKEYFKTIKG